jgi:fatty acid desaturase
MKQLPFLVLTIWCVTGFVAVFSWNQGWLPLTVACVLIASICANSVILASHEAVHHQLSNSKRVNDLLGMLFSIVTLTPFNLYRKVHNTHHGMIGSEKDLEFWPYVNRESKKWHRITAALMELVFAPIYYLVMFSRALPKGGRGASVQFKCYRDSLIVLLTFSAVTFVVANNGWWLEFLIAYLIPEVLAVNMQSWRRLTEHVGLYGDDPLSLTRSITPENPIEKFYCSVMLNENYHAPHHNNLKLGRRELPLATYQLYEQNPDLQHLCFSSYFRAFPLMLRELKDPRIGSQWL